MNLQERRGYKLSRVDIMAYYQSLDWTTWIEKLFGLTVELMFSALPSVSGSFILSSSYRHPTVRLCRQLH